MSRGLELGPRVGWQHAYLECMKPHVPSLILCKLGLHVSITFKVEAGASEIQGCIVSMRLAWAT